MDDYSSDSLEINFSQLNLRSDQRFLENRITTLEKQIGRNTNFIDIALSICENIVEHILDGEDQLNLSAICNNYRKIQITSELCSKLCLVLKKNIDFEIKNMVFQLLNVTKLKEISKKIIEKHKLENEKEKIFVEVVKELNNSIESILSNSKTDKKHDANKYKQTIEKGLLPFSPRRESVLEYQNVSLIPKIFNLSNNATEIRAYPVPNFSNLYSLTPEVLQCYNSPMHHEEDVFQSSIKEPDEVLGNPSQIFKINQETIPDIASPETLSEIVQKANGLGSQIDCTELNSTWKLTSLETIKTPKRKRKPLRIDQKICIHNYAARALDLNRNITIERIQVYEGPPNALKAISKEHMMFNPGFQYSHGLNKTSRLNSLFTRHLQTEKKPMEYLIFSEKKTDINDTYRLNFTSQMPVLNEEEYKLAMRSHRSLVSKKALPDITSDNIQRHEIFNSTDVHNKINVNNDTLQEKTIGNITEPVMQQLNIENRNSITPRIQSGNNMKMRRFFSNSNLPMSYETKKKPPGIEECWMLLNNKGFQEISIKELFTSKEEFTNENYLTLLRVLDKLSLKKKILLNFNQKDITIRPLIALNATK